MTCADCDLTQQIPPLQPGARVECDRCGRLLGRRTRTGPSLTLASLDSADVADGMSRAIATLADRIVGGIAR